MVEEKHMYLVTFGFVTFTKKKSTQNSIKVIQSQNSKYSIFKVQEETGASC